MMHRASQGAVRPPREPALTLDDTTAHVAACPEDAEELFAWFQGRGLRCDLRRQGAAAGLDVVDFGNPSPDQESQIRSAFLDWRRRRPRS
jgi:hypothetical protein